MILTTYPGLALYSFTLPTIILSEVFPYDGPTPKRPSKKRKRKRGEDDDCGESDEEASGPAKRVRRKAVLTVTALLSIKAEVIPYHLQFEIVCSGIF